MLIAKQPFHRPRVLFVLPPFLPTPPTGYGGIEVVAAALLPELHRAGARITVTTPEGSDIKVSEVRTITEPLYSLISRPYEFVAPKIELYITKVMHIAWENKFDVIHDFSGLFAVTNALTAPLRGGKFPPVVHTIHGPMQPFKENYTELSRYKNLTLTGISKAQLNDATLRVRQRSRVVYNCINPSDYPAGPGGERYLVLGRFTHDKGQDRLIEYCAEAGIPLDVAGPVAEMTDLSQIEAEADKGMSSSHANNPDFQLFLKIRHLIDGKLIRFYGNVGGELKHRLLGSAKALVVPNRWSEPFGMVAIEAMASNTPVIAMDTGAMTELIKPQVTGHLASTFEDLCTYLHTDDILEIDRAACRRHVEQNFSAATIAKQYFQLYQEVARPVSISAALNLDLKPTPREDVLYERIATPQTRRKSGV